MDAHEPLLSVSEAARRLGVDVMTVRRLIYRGQLRAARIGKLWRIPADELERLATPVEIAGPAGAPVAATAPTLAAEPAPGPAIRVFKTRVWERPERSRTDDESAASSAAARGRSATTKRAASQRN